MIGRIASHQGAESSSPSQVWTFTEKCPTAKAEPADRRLRAECGGGRAVHAGNGAVRGRPAEGEEVRRAQLGCPSGETADRVRGRCPGGEEPSRMPLVGESKRVI